jgi:hypothetical protein
MNPICPVCKRPCSISGTPLVGSNINTYKCFKCDITVTRTESEDVQATRIRSALTKIAQSYQPSNYIELIEWHDTIRELAIKAIWK